MQRLQLLFVDMYQQINRHTCLQHNYLQASDFSMPKIHILVLGQDSKYEEHNSNIIEADSALCSKGAISPAKLDILECRHPMKRAALTPSPEQEMLIISYTPAFFHIAFVRAVSQCKTSRQKHPARQNGRGMEDGDTMCRR